MSTIGIKDLKVQLGRYVRRAAGGVQSLSLNGERRVNELGNADSPPRRG